LFYYFDSNIFALWDAANSWFEGLKLAQNRFLLADKSTIHERYAGRVTVSE
jgi:hypothetical protein